MPRTLNPETVFLHLEGLVCVASSLVSWLASQWRASVTNYHSDTPQLHLLHLHDREGEGVHAGISLHQGTDSGLRLFLLRWPLASVHFKRLNLFIHVLSAFLPALLLQPVSFSLGYSPSKIPNPASFFLCVLGLLNV